MTIPTHLALGLLIGKISGNYQMSLLVSIAPDIDHFVSYAKHDVLLPLNKFWKVTMDPNDPWGDQKSFLHNILVWFGLSLIAVLLNQKIGLIFATGYLGHLILDALCNSDYYPFYPKKKFRIKGPIVYASKSEFILFVALLLTFFFV